jgi:uncharacterized protein YqhQ
VHDRFVRLRGTALRGIAALADAVSIGWRALATAARVSSALRAEDDQLAIVFVPVLVAVLGVFVVVPDAVAARWTGIGADVAEAGGRAAMLVVYLLAVSRSHQARRLFAYHGAEHKTIAAFERHARVPTLEECRSESPVHVRCGSDFVALFVLAGGVIFSLVTRRPLWLGALARVALMPVVAALGYELMRAAARGGAAWWARALTWPGRALQRITTREPDDGMIEIALTALREAVKPS